MRERARVYPQRSYHCGHISKHCLPRAFGVLPTLRIGDTNSVDYLSTEGNATDVEIVLNICTSDVRKLATERTSHHFRYVTEGILPPVGGTHRMEKAASNLGTDMKSISYSRNTDKIYWAWIV